MALGCCTDRSIECLQVASLFCVATPHFPDNKANIQTQALTPSHASTPSPMLGGFGIQAATGSLKHQQKQNQPTETIMVAHVLAAHVPAIVSTLLNAVAILAVALTET